MLALIFVPNIWAPDAKHMKAKLQLQRAYFTTRRRIFKKKIPRHHERFILERSVTTRS